MKEFMAFRASMINPNSIVVDLSSDLPWDMVKKRPENEDFLASLVFSLLAAFWEN